MSLHDYPTIRGLYSWPLETDLSERAEARIVYIGVHLRKIYIFTVDVVYVRT